MSITRTLAAAFAIAAFGASTAQAQPIDMHGSTAIALAKAHRAQDLRSPDARDAGRNPRNVVIPSRPAHTAPAHTAATVDATSGVDWTSIAIGSAIALLAIGGLAGVNNRRMRRLHRPPTVA